jgi:hypothetical protein
MKGTCDACRFEGVQVAKYPHSIYRDGHWHDAMLCEVCANFFCWLTHGADNVVLQNLAIATNLVLKAIREHERKHHGK